jgi:hypothetical protein
MYPIEKRRAFLLPLFLSKKSRSRRTKKKTKKSPLLSLSLSLFLSLFFSIFVSLKKELSLSLFFFGLSVLFLHRTTRQLFLPYIFTRRSEKSALSATISLESSQPFLSLSLLPPPHFFQKESRQRERTKRFATTLPGNCARDFRE